MNELKEKCPTNEAYTFLAIADVHIGWKLFNLPELADDLKEDFIRAVDLAIKLKVTYLFIVGDLFDINKPTPDLIAFVKTQVDRAAKAGVIMAGIAGDHDKPINENSWIHLTGVVPINDLNDPRFVGYDYCDQSMLNIKAIDELTTKKQVEWIFLHGQVPGLFDFCEEKKLLDFKQVDLIGDFPNLKGVVLGDIHYPSESVVHDPKEERQPLPFIGYCGSLGMVKSSEIGNKKGILYFDGNKLKRIPFELTRKFIKIILSEAFTPINWISKYSQFFKEHKGKKPLIVVEYNSSEEEKLPLLNSLYEVALVKLSKVSKTQDNEAEAINLRSELTTNKQTSAVLRKEFTDDVAFNLASALIDSEDEATTILDKFKASIFNA